MFLLGFNHFFQFRFFYYLVVFCSLLLVQCQPTNTTVGKSISKGGVTSGTGANSNVTSQLQQLRLTDANHQLLTGQQLSVAVGDTLNLHADIYTLGGEKVSEAQVRWNLRAVSGQTTTGLSCSGTVTNTCDFTPTAPGSVYVEINSVERNSQVVAPTDTSPLVVVTAPSVPTALELTSGNLQTGIVNSLVAQPLNVTVKDAFGRGIQGVEVNFNVTAGTGTITTSNPHITDAQGTASAQFRLGTSTLTPQSHQVVATVASAPSLTQTFTASALPASLASLQFSTPPLATYALLPFYQQPVVVAHDTYGNTMTTLLDPLTVMVKTGGGTLTGSTTKNFTNGVVTFNDLAYSTTDSNVELRFTVGTIHLDSAPLNFIAATGQPNITPDDVHFGFKVSSVAGPAGRKTSDPVTIGGLSQNISVSVSGPGNPKLLKNSDVVEMPALFNVANTDTIRVVADSPSTTHGVHVITVNMGGRTETFEVRYADPNVVVYGFVTSSMQNGAGVNDSICAVDAAARGYLGSWKGIFATTSQSIKERIPSQWGQMKRLDGQVVASSWEQLWTGVLTNPLNTVIDGSTGSLNVWTGASDASTQTNLANSCQNWTSVTVTDNARLGLSSETSTNWYSNTSLSCGGFPRMYCISVPTGVQDTNPNDVSFSEQVATSGTQRLTSNSVTVSGVTTPILVSITATGGNPRIKINSGAEVTSGTVGNGDQITLVMDAPSVLNQKNTATLTLGDDSVTWWVGLADTSRTAAIFVSSVDYNGDLGGLAGAHSKCQSLADAQGFGGTWKAVLNTTSAGPAQNIVSWSWGTLKRLDGAVVATSWNDLWDGTIGVPISLTETLVTKNSFVTTGNILDTGLNCVNFATSNGIYGTNYGDSSVTTTWLHNGSSDYSCAFTKPIYCMSDPSGAADTTPLPIGFPMTVTYNSGETLDSNEITVLGITSPMTVTLTGSQGSPVLKINNVAAAGNTALVNLGDKVKITMTAPTVLGTQHTATLMYGSFLETWKLGYADSSKVAHVFVSSKVFSTSSGVNNLDNSCTTAAESAGLGGTWKALVATESDNATDRAPWNWGSLKLVDNSTLIATSWSDLWDGTLLHPINMDENLTPNLAIEVETGFTVNGIKITDRTMGSWSGGFSSYGLTGHSDSRWANNSPGYTSLANAYFYCFEDTSAAPDTTPTDLRLAYKVFQDPSTTVTSATYVVRGITAGSVPFTLTDLSAGGAAAATYSINGGASQNAGTPSYVKGGDGITLSMTTPATTNSSYKATFTVGDSVAIPWRVWTKGVTSGTLIKRMFVSNAMYVCNYGGLTGLNNQCQSMATGKGLSGTWVALVSGVPYDEPNFAINRVGYNWTELWTIDASGNPANRVLSAPNLWNNSTLESAPNVDVNGATISTTTFVATNTEFDGKNLDTNTTACNGFASLNFELFYRGQSSGSLANSLWLNQDANGKNDTSHRLYCIEQ